MGVGLGLVVKVGLSTFTTCSANVSQTLFPFKCDSKSINELVGQIHLDSLL